VSRLVRALAGDAPRALKAIRAARAAARERAWALAGDAAPGAGGGPVIIDLDATIVIAHSDKEQACPTQDSFPPARINAGRPAARVATQYFGERVAESIYQWAVRIAVIPSMIKSAARPTEARFAHPYFRCATSELACT
jgi:hypothetical protein